MDNDLEQKIRESIIEEVFVRGKDERIFPEAKWLMDFRRVCLDPGFLDTYTEIFYERFKDRYPFQVGGMEVAAIPLVSAIIMKMRERGKPVNGFFIRKSRKKMGLLKMIEGKLTDDPVILVDDLINNGYTLDRQLKVMEEAGKQVAVFFPLLRFRSPETYRRYSEQGILIDALFGLDEFQAELGTRLLDGGSDTASRESFAVKWYFKAPDAKLEMVVPKSGVVWDDERIYLGSDRGTIYALRRADGTVAWEHRIGLGPWGSKRDKEIFSTPVLHEGRLYFGAYDGNIYRVDATTGQRVWVSFEADWIGGSAVISETTGTLYVPTMFGSYQKKGGLVALDVATGKARWRARFDTAVRGTPLSEALGMIYMGTESGEFYALHAATGAIAWRFQSGGAIKDAAIYDAVTRAIIFASFDGGVYKLSADTGTLLWKYDIGLANYSAPFVWRDRVFVCSLDKHLYCLDRESGKKLWSFPARARIFSSPRVYRDRLYFGGNDARMYEIDPMTGKQTGFFQVTERITNPVVCDEKTGDIYLQTYANEVYCLREKTEEV